MTRRMCDYPGCDKPGRNKGFYKGAIRYDHHCERHHKRKDDLYFGRQRIDASKCSVCGWDKASCDRHRIEPNKGYVKSNIAVLCPNCHRLVTFGLLKLK